MSETTPGIGQKRPDNDDINLLLKKLRDFDDNVRIDAAKRLGRYPQPEVVKALVGRLIDRSAHVRWYVIDTLVTINDKSVCESITAKLKDEIPEVRGKAAEALGILGCKGSAMALVEAVDDASEDVAKYAGIALGKLADIESVNELIDRLDAQERKKRCFALAQFDHMIIQPLVKKTDFHYEDYNDKEDANRISRYFENRVMVLKLLEPQPFEGVTKFYNNPKEGLNYKRRDPHIDDGASELYVKCGYNSKNLLIAKYLIELNDPRAVPWLCKILMEDQAPIVRWLILEKFAKMTTYSEDVVRAILNPLTKDFPLLRINAAKSLAQMKATLAVPPLCKIIESDKDKNVVYAAITATGDIGDIRAVPTLINKLINDDESGDNRRLAAEALGKLPSAEGTEALISALGSDGNPNVRKTAAISLGNLRAKEAKGPLGIVAGGRDESKDVIEAAKAASQKLK